MKKECSNRNCTNRIPQNKDPRSKYCCDECAYEERKTKAIKIKRTCQNESCEKTYKTGDKRSKYCSSSCAAKVNNTKFPKRKKANTGIFCWCGNELKYYQTKGCSQKHAAKQKSMDIVFEWLTGNLDGGHASGDLRPAIRLHLLEQANNRCQSPSCYVPGGWSIPNSKLGRPILTINHIDGNWKNNTRDNLEVLCYNCHSLTDTFGRLNENPTSGRRIGT